MSQLTATNGGSASVSSRSGVFVMNGSAEAQERFINQLDPSVREKFAMLMRGTPTTHYEVKIETKGDASGSINMKTGEVAAHAVGPDSSVIISSTVCGTKFVL
jgi:hypothetical protein